MLFSLDNDFELPDASLDESSSDLDEPEHSYAEQSKWNILPHQRVKASNPMKCNRKRSITKAHLSWRDSSLAGIETSGANSAISITMYSVKGK
jgi:hypothetical protein